MSMSVYVLSGVPPDQREDQRGVRQCNGCSGCPPQVDTTALHCTTWTLSVSRVCRAVWTVRSHARTDRDRLAHTLHWPAVSSSTLCTRNFHSVLNSIKYTFILLTSSVNSIPSLISLPSNLSQYNTTQSPAERVRERPHATPPDQDGVPE